VLAGPFCAATHISAISAAEIIKVRRVGRATKPGSAAVPAAGSPDRYFSASTVKSPRLDGRHVKTEQGRRNRSGAGEIAEQFFFFFFFFFFAIESFGTGVAETAGDIDAATRFGTLNGTA